MRVCASSRSFARQLTSQRLTQLEWIDIVSEQAFDGVDLSVEHFPRRDADYLAQIKKLCVDRCLSVAGVNTALAFGSGPVDPQIDILKATIDVANAIGAPLVRFACGAAEGSPGIAWRELVRGLKAACEYAKALNVTLAVAPRNESLVATDAEVKRAFKECDSAWLRLALPALPGWRSLERDAVIMVLPPEGAEPAEAARFRGFVSLEDEAGGQEAEQLRCWISSLFGRRT